MIEQTLSKGLRVSSVGVGIRQSGLTGPGALRGNVPLALGAIINLNFVPPNSIQQVRVCPGCHYGANNGSKGMAIGGNPEELVESIIPCTARESLDSQGVMKNHLS